MDKQNNSLSRASSTEELHPYAPDPRLSSQKRRKSLIRQSISSLKKPINIQKRKSQYVLKFDKKVQYAQPTLESSQTVNTLVNNTNAGNTEIVFSKKASGTIEKQIKQIEIDGTNDTISTKLQKDVSLSVSQTHMNLSLVVTPQIPQIEISVPYVPPLDKSRYIRIPGPSNSQQKKKKSRSVFESLTQTQKKRKRNHNSVSDIQSIQSIQVENEKFFNQKFGELKEDKVYFNGHLGQQKYSGSLPKLTNEEIKFYQLQKDILEGSLSKKNIKFNKHFKWQDPTRNEFLSEKLKDDLQIMRKQVDIQRKKFEQRNEQSSMFLDSTQNSKNSLFNSQSVIFNSKIDSIIQSRSQLELMKVRNVSKDFMSQLGQAKNRSLLRYPLVDKKKLPQINHYRSLSDVDPLPQRKSITTQASPLKIITNETAEQQTISTKNEFTKTGISATNQITETSKSKKTSTKEGFDYKFDFKMTGSLDAYKNINLSLKKQNDLSLTILDKKGKDFENALLDQLEYEAEQLAVFKKKMNKYKKELQGKDKHFCDKMEWLSEKIPIVEPNTIKLLQEEDMEVPYGLHAVRASNFIKHMLQIDDKLTDQIDEAHEIIKDQPDGDVEDRYYIQEFKAQRKRERAKSLLLKQMKLQSRQELLDLLRKSLETKNKHRRLKYTEDGKIDVDFCLKKFAKKRRFQHNNNDFEFEEAVREIIESINEEFIKKQNTKNLDYVFESQEQFDYARAEKGFIKYDEKIVLKQEREKKISEFERYLIYVSGTESSQQEKNQKSDKEEASQFAKELLALKSRKTSTQNLRSLDHQSLFNYVELVTKHKAQLRDSFINRIRQFENFKRSLNESKAHEFRDDPMFQYMNECSKHLDLILPILSRVSDGVLTLSDYKLQLGHCRGISSACKADPFFLNRVILFRNNISDDMFAELLSGLKKQSNLKRLSYSYNSIGNKSLQHLKDILAKNIPMHLMELRISNCPMTRSDFMPQLINILNTRSYLQNLYLVSVPLKGCYNELCEYIQNSRHLRKLDLSYNTIPSPQKLMKVIARNINLTEINLSWNNLSKCTKYLRKLIKRNQGLSHLILTQTSLSLDDIITLSNHIIGSKSLQVVHFCKNIDVTDDVLQQLRAIYQHRMINPAKRQSLYIAPYQRHQEVETKISNIKLVNLSGAPISDFHREAIIIKEINNRKKVEQRQQSSHVDHELEHLMQQHDKKLILSRNLGHSKDMMIFSQGENPQNWKILHKPFHKCWICSLNRYTILFWKKEHFDKPSSLDNLDEDQFFEEKAEEIFKANPEQKDKVMICGSFNNWKPQQMVRLTEFLDFLDPDIPDIIQIMRQKGSISSQSQKTYNTVKDLSKKQQQIYYQIQSKIYNQKRKNWPEILLKRSVQYKEPAIVNGEILNDLQSVAHISDIYVFITFMEPGKNDYVVRYMPTVKDKRKDIELKWAEGPHQNAQNTFLDESSVDKLDKTETIDEFSRNSGSSLESSDYSFSDRVQYFHGRAIVDVRSEDVITTNPLSNNNSSNKKNFFDLSKSQFAEFAEINTPKFFSQALQYDMLKIEDQLIELTNDQVHEQQAIKQNIEENYNQILRLYSALRSNITQHSQYPYVWSRQLVYFSQLAGISKKIGFKKVQEQVEKQPEQLLRFNLILFLLDVCICLVEIDQEEKSKEIKDNPQVKAEKVAKVAENKLKTAVKAVQAVQQMQIRPKISQKIKTLFDQFIVPNIDKIEVFEHDWREKFLYSSEIDNLFQVNKVALTQIYRSHASSIKRNLYIDDLINLLTNHQDIGDLTISKDQIISCFSMSKLPLAIETNDQITKSYLRMSYPEFLDFITRLAVVKFQDSDQVKSLSLHEKIVHVLDDIFESIGIQAKDPARPFLPSQLAKQQKQFSKIGEDFESPLPKGYAGEMLIKDFLLSKKNSLMFDPIPIAVKQKYGDREYLKATIKEDSSSESSCEEQIN